MAVYQIRTLTEYGELTFENGAAKWNKTKAFIAQMPNNAEPYEWLAAFSLTEDGTTFANNLRALYNELKQRKPNANLV